MNVKLIEKKLGQCAPTVVNVILANGDQKELRPPQHTRKRWLPIMSMLERLEWRRLELLDRHGGILDMIDNDDVAPETRVDASSDPMLKTMITAQREALTWQDKSVRAALDTCVQVMAQMHDSVAMIVELHRQERQQQQALLRDLEAAAAAAAAERGDDSMPQAEIVRALAPMLLQRLMAAGAGGKNGAT